MKKRCDWVPLDDPLYVKYHDKEWGVPVHDDRKIFEFLLLEAMQAGLSWRTILVKRDNFRRAFRDFDPEIVAAFDEIDIERLMSDAGIIRNRAKINASVNNAHRFLEVQGEFGSFDAYIWRFVGNNPIRNRFQTHKEIPASTPESDALSADLKKRGFKFLGPTTVYAHMQAAGMVNDHTTGCFRYGEV
ncbi:DNA-3-methyladenine glycosylase I [candidate division KSB1 bacterium]